MATISAEGVIRGPLAIEVAKEFDHLLREVVGGCAAATQGVCGELIGTRSAADTEVDASRMERLEHAELLGNDKGRVVRQHHSARTHTDRRGD